VLKLFDAANSGFDYDDHADLPNMPVVDYTCGAAQPPPSHDVIPRQVPQRPAESDVVVDYSERGVDVTSPYERKLDMSRIPGWVRRDYVAGQRMAAAQENRAQPWDQIQFDHRVVDFPATPEPQRGSGFLRDALGRSIPNSRHWG
jgi:hypothetical protein